MPTIDIDLAKPTGANTLEGYLRFIMMSSLSDFLLTPHNGVQDFGTDIGSVVLHRAGQFQTELFVAPREWNTTTSQRNYHFSDGGPMIKMQQHRHPNVDSYEVPLCGRIHFYKNGVPLATPEKVAEVSKRGQSGVYGSFTRILPTDWHGAAFGYGGGAFLSVQHWLNDVKPSSVGLDWEAEDEAFRGD